MPAEIDIIVSSPDSIGAQLIVETKLHLPDLQAAEGRLRNAMLQLSCPVGLIVTPERIRIYEDKFLSKTPESIERVGEFDAGQLLQFKPTDNSQRTGRFFESYVQRWLEDLPRTARSGRVPDKDLLQALNKYVLPAVETGEVRAAAPRY